MTPTAVLVSAGRLHVALKEFIDATLQGSTSPRPKVPCWAFSPSKFRRLREARGITQKQLAKQLLLGNTAVSQWEIGRNTPTVKDLCVCAILLNCSPGDFFEEREASQ